MPVRRLYSSRFAARKAVAPRTADPRASRRYAALGMMVRRWGVPESPSV